MNSVIHKAELWNSLEVPQTIPVHRLEVEKRRLTGSTIILESLSFQAGPYLGKPKNVFAYYAYPEAGMKDKHPTVLIVHGGQCVAWSDAVCALVDRGYAALMLDLPGKGSKRDASRSTGPSMGDANFHRDPSLNFLFHAVDSARHALAALRGFPQTDLNRVAVMGDSWGSIISSIFVSMEQDVAALVLVNACGFIFYPEWGGRLGPSTGQTMGPLEVEEWDAQYDPRHYYQNISCPVLLGYTRNETLFSKKQFEASYRLLVNQNKKLVIGEGNHEIDWPTREKIYKWLGKRLSTSRKAGPIHVSGIPD